MLSRRLALSLLAALAGAAGLSSCGGLALAIANAPALSGKFTRIADVPFGDGERDVLDVYAPERARGAPVVVFWFGGSWTRGDKAHYRFVGAALAEAGLVAVLPNYRLYPQAKFPQFLDDGARALKFVHDNAQRWGGDPDALFVMGHSAGAHLAATMALDARYLERVGGEPSWIKGLIGLAGPYFLEPNSALLDAVFAAPFVADDWQPGRRVSSTSPPALLVHGSNDRIVVPRHSEELLTRLRASGVSAELLLLSGRGHADPVAALSVPARGRGPVLARTVEFVRALNGGAQTGLSR